MLSFHKWEDPPPSLPRYLTDFKINENYLPYSLLKISLIYTSTMFTFQCHYCAKYFIDTERLIDLYCIPSKTSANKTLVSF